MFPLLLTLQVRSVMLVLREVEVNIGNCSCSKIASRKVSPVDCVVFGTERGEKVASAIEYRQSS